MEAVDYIPRLIKACLDNDRRLVESVALVISRKMHHDYPNLSKEIASALASGNSQVSARAAGVNPLPVDRETRFLLAEFSEPLDLDEPILDSHAGKEITDFLRERSLIEQFFKNDIEPSNSILFVGDPGVGKTHTAHWLAGELRMPLISLDLATSISSYLGRSGQNIKSVFDYARSQPSVLLLDEFDAIAKRRDDEGDLGELKRLVNVLLKEIECCPKSSIILAATNHPELLDKAIWRRFDRVVEIRKPGKNERKKIIDRHLSRKQYKLASSIRDYIAKCSEGFSAADICKLCEHIKRQALMNPDEDLRLLALVELYSRCKPETAAKKREACIKLKSIGANLTTREIGQIVGASAATVSRNLKEVNND